MPKGRNVVLPLEVGLLTEKAIQRFHAKTEVQADGCILWTGTQTPQSYGFFWIGGYARPAHRVAWMIQHRRDIPPDADIDHLCRVHDCVNPDHLEAVTHWENMRRGVSPVTGTLNGLATDGTCARGHDLSLPGAWRHNAKGRYCSACHLAKVREGRERRSQNA